MTALYSVRDAAKVFDLKESRLRYWAQTAVVSGSVRRSGRFYYTLGDLAKLRTVVELLAKGVSVQTVRKNLEGLRADMAREEDSLLQLAIRSDGQSARTISADAPDEQDSEPAVVSFSLADLSEQVAQALHLPHLEMPTPKMTRRVEQPRMSEPDRRSAYSYFLDGCEAEDSIRLGAAEDAYAKALTLEPSMAAARTNLGNVLYRKGDLDGAKREYEIALEHEPTQPEARFNMANLLEDKGEIEHAIGELRRVCASTPEFADAHYNLGLLLARVGGIAQAKSHLERYIALDTNGIWSHRARQFLAALNERTGVRTAPTKRASQSR